MSKSENYNISAIFGDEDTYGTLNAAGDGVKFSIISSTIAPTQNKTNTNEFDGNYVQAAPIDGNITVAGDITLRVRPKSIGYVLAWLYGAPVTTGAGPTYTHTFTASSTVASSFQMEIYRSDITVYELYTGLVITDISSPVVVEGQLQITVSVVGRDADFDNVASVFIGTVTDLTGETEVFNSIDGTVSAGTTFIANSVNYKITRPAEQFYAIGDGGIASEVFKSKFEASGDVTVLFQNTDLLTKARNSTADNISVGATDGTNSITFNNPTVKWDLTSQQPDSNTVQQLLTVPFRAYGSLNCVLVNTLASY